MRILAVGDTHGDETPLSIAKDHIDEVDKAIFHGDYADSFDSRWPQQKEVLEKILDFKFENSDKVDLLWGNHDHAYISDPHVSGHQNVFAHDMREFFLKYLPYFQIVSVYDKWIFSHAGVSETWLERHPKNFIDDSSDTEPLKVDEINQMFAQKYWSIFDHLSLDPYGDSEEEGPLWIRPRALLHSGVIGYNQCVGHTEVIADASSDDRIISLDKIIKDPARMMECGERLYQKYALIDSRARDIYAIIDTDTNEVTIERYKE